MIHLCTATVPGSKSMTNRALLLAALSNREYLLRGAQFSDDSRYFLEALKALGFSAREDEAAKSVCITGTGGCIPKKSAEIYVGSAGTAARFLTAMLACSDGVYTIRASEQMSRRPMKPLFDALTSLGAEFVFLGEAGHLPVRVRGIFSEAANDGSSAEEAGGCDSSAGVKLQGAPKKEASYEVSLDISESTQYLSALLMTATMLPGGLTVHITGEKKSGSYIEITRSMMAEFAIPSEFDGADYRVKGCFSPFDVRNTGETEGRITYLIEPDVSAACYFYAAAMLTGYSVQVTGVHEDTVQGDWKFLELLGKMGAEVTDLPGGVRVTPPAGCCFPGLEVNMNDFSDQAITLAALAPFAKSPTVISGIAHIRRQESDRLHGIAENLTRMGIRALETEDSVTIWPGAPKPCEIETCDDHRMAMGFALVGLRVPGIKIRHPECCQKTFKEYFDEMEKVFGLRFSNEE